MGLQFRVCSPLSRLGIDLGCCFGWYEQGCGYCFCGWAGLCYGTWRLQLSQYRMVWLWLVFARGLRLEVASQNPVPFVELWSGSPRLVLYSPAVTCTNCMGIAVALGIAVGLTGLRFKVCSSLWLWWWLRIFLHWFWLLCDYDISLSCQTWSLSGTASFLLGLQIVSVLWIGAGLGYDFCSRAWHMVWEVRDVTYLMLLLWFAMMLERSGLFVRMVLFAELWLAWLVLYSPAVMFADCTRIAARWRIVPGLRRWTSVPLMRWSRSTFDEGCENGIRICGAVSSCWSVGWSQSDPGSSSTFPGSRVHGLHQDYIRIVDCTRIAKMNICRWFSFGEM